jgi:integrase
LLEDFRSRAADGTPRELAPSSMARARAVLRGAFSNAVARRLIEWDPWTAVEPEAGHEPHIVDPDLVMTPDQITALAAACAAIDPRYEAFVLLQGFCGLRPSEAIELRRRRLDLDGTPPKVTLAGSYNPVPDRYLQPGETRRRPLKGRGRRVTRTIPIPAKVAVKLRDHLAEFTGAGGDALVFVNTIGGRIDLSNFHRDVWKHAVAATFPTGPLRGVRRQDLRHAAITLWLNSGVPLKVAQTWSGHKTLSVLLDTYYGVMQHDEHVAYQRVEDALDP